MDVTKDTYDTFLSSVLAKVPDERRELIEQAFKDDLVAPMLRDAVLARADYSRKLDEFGREVSEARGQIAQWQDWYAGEVETAAARQQRLEQYQELYGDLDEEHQPPAERQHEARAKETAVAGIDEKTLNATLATRDQLAIQFADVLTDLKLDHRDKFGEKLDTTALMKYSTDHGVNIRDAYRALTADQEAKLAETRIAEREAAAREAGRQEVLTQHKLPTGPPRREPHFLENKDYSKTPSERVSRAVAAFNAGMSSGR